MENQNPHNIPFSEIIWLKRASRHESPLKRLLGYSSKLRAVDGRPFVRIAELHAPETCTYECHPDNFHPMDDLAKRIALGMETTSGPWKSQGGERDE